MTPKVPGKAVWLLVLCLALLGGGAHAQPGDASLQGLLDDFVRDQRLPGAVLGIGGPRRDTILATGVLDLSFGEDDPDRLPFLPPADRVGADAVVTEPELGLFAHLHLGDHPARRRIQAGELDPGGFAHDAASAVAADEIFGSDRRAVRHLDIDPGVVLGKARHLRAVIDMHGQLGEPVGHDPLDPVLPQPERVRMPRGEVAHVQHAGAERRHLSDLPRGEEPISDATLIQHLDRARVKPAGA